jgi:alanine racemase
VTLLGETMTIHRMADLIDCNVDEVVCNISKRVPRVYE